MRVDENRLAVGMLVATSVWALVLAFAGGHDAVLFLAPALLLALPLALSRYPGEQALQAIVSARGRRAFPRNATVSAPVPSEQPFSGILTFGGSITRRGPPILLV